MVVREDSNGNWHDTEENVTHNKNGQLVDIIAGQSVDTVENEDQTDAPDVLPRRRFGDVVLVDVKRSYIELFTQFSR